MARKYSGGKAKQTILDSERCTALYLRVSTDKQADEGYSLDAQRERLDAYCTAQGWNVCAEHIYVDAGISGKTTDRAAFQSMLEAARDGAIVRIVAMKLDRLARNVRDFLAMVDELNSAGCALVLVKESFDTSTPHGKFALTMFAAMAELEASTITERVMAGKRQKAATGGYNGSRCPMGYSYSNGAFTVTEQAPTVQRIFSLFNAGASLNAISRELNRDGTLTATGKLGSWTPYGVSHILRNGFYAGLAEWDGLGGLDGEQLAIISRADYEAAQTKFSTMSRGKRVDRMAA